jgi:lysophospholipase L1-like esterase
MTARLLVLFCLFLSPPSALAAAEPAVHERAGLPHVATRAASGTELRVAYLGGSITAAEGWRPLTTAWLRGRYPQATVTEIPAGLPGTGSNLGACRLGHDVLVHQPDLLFVEFAVNDAKTPAESIQRTMEGIVRQTWRANPATDICFVYTVSAPGLPDLEAGRFPASAQAMETVAAHYGIPSVHFGIEVVRRIASGTLAFKGTTADDHTFSLDGVHPTPAGHRAYFSVLEQALPGLLSAPAAQPHALPAALRADNWEGASLRPIDAAMRRGAWTQVPPDDPNLRGVTKALLPPTWRTAAPGAAIEFEFTGRRFGLLGIAAPDSGTFRVTVDGLPPVTDTFFDAYASPTFCRQREWFYPGELVGGPHRVRIELDAAPPDKAAIKAKAGKPLGDPAPYAAQTLTLSAVLLIGPNPP